MNGEDAGFGELDCRETCRDFPQCDCPLAEKKGDWAHPDFSDPRFAIERVDKAAMCRHEGCDRLAVYLVDYTMRRGGWTYEYGCGYCAEHLPAEVAAEA